MDYIPLEPFQVFGRPLQYTVHMEFFNSMLHALAALAVGLAVWLTPVLGLFSTSEIARDIPPATITVQEATTSPFTIATATNAVIPPAKGSVATTAPKSAAVPPTPKTAPVSVSTTSSTVPAVPSPPPAISNETIARTNTGVRPSIVNILCNFRTVNTSSYISGSGIIVDSHGVVLTNAHVAQFFLLKNYPSRGGTTCVIRTGSPATSAYLASLLYLPPLWIDKNASQILATQPKGTGERDYAFLYITGPAQFASPLPSSFPALSLSLDILAQGDPVLLAGYPAGFLDANGVQRNLYISSAVSAIQQLYTFNSPSEVDLVSLGGTVVSQSGSSGGAVVDLTNGKLTGLIATESEGTTTASRDLRAVTLDYINRNLKADGQGGIAGLLSGDFLAASEKFNTDIAPDLTNQLTAAIEKQL